jgi:exosome complex component RRP40
VVLPDQVAAADSPLRVVRVGAGLRAEPVSATTTTTAAAAAAAAASVSVAAAKAGVLRAAPRTGQLWVDGVRSRRYIPGEEDPVVGRVLDKAGAEHYSVDVGAPFPALLPQLAFEGATRRNRPVPAPGDLVYARVTSAPRDSDATLACTDAAGQSAGFGLLAGGALARITPAFARALLRQKPPAPVLVALGKHAGAFEVAVGANGRVWVAAPTISGLASVVRVLESAEAVPPTGAERWVEETLREWAVAAGEGGAAGGGAADEVAAARQLQGGDDDGSMELDLGLSS